MNGKLNIINLLFIFHLEIRAVLYIVYNISKFFYMFKKNSNIDIVFNIAESHPAFSMVGTSVGSYHVWVYKVDMGRPIVK